MNPLGRAATILAATILAATLALVGGVRSAHAQGFAVKDIIFAEVDAQGNETRRLTESELVDYFGRARCDCDAEIKVIIRITPDSKQLGTFKVVSGTTDCINNTTNEILDNCQIHKEGRIQDQRTDIEFNVKASALMTLPGGNCDSVGEKTITISVLTDQNNDQYAAQAKNRVITVDTAPPLAPIAPSGDATLAGEGLVKVTFEKPSTDEQNVEYQILCRIKDNPTADPLPNTSHTPRFQSAANICPTRTQTAGDAGMRATDQGVSDTTEDFFVDFGNEDFSVDGDASPVSDAGVDDAAATGSDELLSAQFVCSDHLTSAGSVSVSGLTNGVTYEFYVVAIDKRRNASTITYLGEETPAAEEDLWERYKRAGGGASGGCALGNDPLDGGTIGLLALLGALLGTMRRRRRKRLARGARAAGKGKGKSKALLLALIVGVGATATVRVAHAQGRIDPQIVDDSEYHSPQWFAAEFKLGPYKPSIDSEFSGDGPYARIFDGGGLMLRWEFDVQVWHGFGSLGIGVVGGYFRRSAQAFIDDGGGGTSSGTERSGGETSIMLVPISVLAVYRFDVLANRWHIPVVPFVKFGVNYTLWWIFNGSGDVASVDGDKARGGSWGLAFNAGLELQLDFLEPGAAKTLDAEVGINHTYLFFEFAYTGADGFGAAGKLDVGDATWQAGLAFEF